MPRLDGVLYEYEKAALKPKKEPVAKAKVKRAKPVPVVEEPEVKGTIAPEITGQVAVNKGGRPAVLKKLTPEAIDSVIANVRAGLPQESALVLAGISRSAVEYWRKRNPLLQIKFEQAEADYEKVLLGNQNGFAATDARANQWLMERRIQGRWAPVTKAELTGKDGAALGLMTVSQQLFASVAGGADAAGAGKAKPVAIDVDAKAAP